MLRFRYSVPVYGGLTIGFRVDAERVEEAHTIATAYLLTLGHTNFNVRKHLMALEGGSPDGVKPGVVRGEHRTDRSRTAPFSFQMVYGAPPCADFASVESRVKERLNQMVNEGVVASFKDGRGWINLYMREDGSVHAGGVYTSKAGAETIATRNGNGYRSSQALMTWDRTKGVPDKGKLYPDGNGGWQKADGKPVSIKPFENTDTVEKCKMRFDNVVSFSGAPRTVDARTVGEEIHRAVESLVAYAGPSLPARYASWNSLTHGEQRHFKNRLVSWAGLQSAAVGRGCALCVNDYGHDGSSDYITMSVSSPRWEDCLNRLKAWLNESGIPYTKPSTSTVKVKWSIIAQYLTPL